MPGVSGSVMNNPFVCPVCGWRDESDSQTKYDHCPKCLCKKHGVDEEGYECLGTMEPVSVWVKDDDEWDIILRCKTCGEMALSRLDENDDPIKVLSVAVKPLAEPPFPIEKIESLTEVSGCSGNIGGYKNEQGK